MPETPFDSNHETLVFVYGTLMRGQRNHSLLFGARYVSEGLTRPEYELVDLGDFPALIPSADSEDGFPVCGEVYAVDQAILEILDEIEDHPRFYRRTPTELEDGSLVDVYLLTAHQAAFYPRIVSGDWRSRAKAV